MSDSLTKAKDSYFSWQAEHPINLGLMLSVKGVQTKLEKEKVRRTLERYGVPFPANLGDFMVAHWFRNEQGYLHPFWAKFFLTFYVPFLGAGIRMRVLANDYKYLRVEMPLTWYNHNYVGTAFGGSIYAMTDPFYMFMLMQILGRDYVVWDKAANIDFIKPGRSRLIAEFKLTDDELALVREQTAGGNKYLFDKVVLIHDDNGELIARVIKTLYVRKKDLAGKAK